MQTRWSAGLLTISFLVLVIEVLCQNCGQQHLGIPGLGVWQWAVAIMKADGNGIPGLRCSGFLIDRKHVISAAQCFQFGECAKDFTARVRHSDANRVDLYDISNITTHENYIPGLFYNDIALLTLSREVDNPSFVPICLPGSIAEKNLTGKVVTGVGYSVVNREGKKEVSMQRGMRSVISNYMCGEKFKEFHETFPQGITRQIICTLNGVPICYGSSGGPLMFEEKGKWYAIGLTTFVQSCNRPSYPEGYTRVSEYLKWIEDKKMTSRDSLSTLFNFSSIEGVYQYESRKQVAGPK